MPRTPVYATEELTATGWRTTVVTPIDLSPKARRTDIMADAYALLKIIDAEFRTDPMSVQCFDLRVVERVRKCINTGDRLNKELPDHIKL